MGNDASDTDLQAKYFEVCSDVQKRRIPIGSWKSRPSANLLKEDLAPEDGNEQEIGAAEDFDSGSVVPS